jgi:3-deoxy-D-manno-octulosonic-acid transferase
LLAYIALTRLLQPLMPIHLWRRRRKHKEHQQRWPEKMGRAMADRPEGRLVWLHAVGLGEALALRGLISRLSVREDLSFLVTSGTRVSGEILSRDLPPHAQHQFMPFDLPGPSKRFLDHWHPDLAVWSEQDLWPGLVMRSDIRGIPLVLVNARMNADAYARRSRFKPIYADILPRFALISAQDDRSAFHLRALGAPKVHIDGSLKVIAPPLMVDPEIIVELRKALKGRFIWVVGSSHAEDEALAILAHKAVLARDPTALLIIAPRRPQRVAEIAKNVADAEMSVALRSRGADPTAQVYIADTFGEMGLWYSLTQVVYVGGTNGSTEGHNPWEPLALGAAVLHGPQTANFKEDYAALASADGAKLVNKPNELAALLVPEVLWPLRDRGQAVRRARMGQMDGLCQSLLDLILD